MQKHIFALIVANTIGVAIAAETPLCALPLVNAKTTTNASIAPGCSEIYSNALITAKVSKAKIILTNDTSIPEQLSVGSVYLQPINMAPVRMMRPRDKSDIHLELDIHAKANLKLRGFAPGDWLPYVHITYSIQKIGQAKPLVCSTDKNKHDLTTCSLMAMVASDGAHYGDNVKLDGPGFYVVTFNAQSQPMELGWHTDTDSKILGTEYVDWKFKQSYIFKYTGIGKKGGY